MISKVFIFSHVTAILVSLNRLAVKHFASNFSVRYVMFILEIKLLQTPSMLVVRAENKKDWNAIPYCNAGKGIQVHAGIEGYIFFQHAVGIIIFQER